jgi:hypothetical protein
VTDNYPRLTFGLGLRNNGKKQEDQIPINKMSNDEIKKIKG